MTRGLSSLGETTYFLTETSLLATKHLNRSIATAHIYTISYNAVKGNDVSR